MHRSFHLALPLLALGHMASAQDASTNADVLFILDGSGSMWGRVNEVEKIVIAKDVMSGLIDGLPESVDAGLITYGHRERGSCADIEVIATPGQTDRADLLASLAGVTPLGKTPISDSLLRAGEVMRQTEDPVSIVLVSDGIESCEGDPCATAALLREQDIDVRIHVVGFDVDAEAKEQLSCIAEAGGGEYYDASSADALDAALADVRVSIVEEPVVTIVEPTIANVFLGDDVLNAVSVVNEKTGEELDTLYSSGGAGIEVPAGTYRYAFRHFTSPPVEIVAGQDYIIRAADYGLATLSVSEDVFFAVDIVEHATDTQLTDLYANRQRIQVAPTDYRFAFRHFTSPPVSIAPSADYEISARTFGLADIYIDEDEPYSVDILDDTNGQQLAEVSAVSERTQVPPGDYRFEFFDFTSPTVTIAPNETVTISSADYGLADVFLADDVLFTVNIVNAESAERLTEIHRSFNRRQIPPGTYIFEFKNFTSPPLTVAPGSEHMISAANYGLARVELADDVFLNVDIVDDVTGQKLDFISGSSSVRQIPAGRYRFEFSNFTSPPMDVVANADITIAAADYGLADIRLSDDVIGQVSIIIDETDRRLTNISRSSSRRQIPPGTYHFAFADFVSPPIVIAPGEQRVLSAADFNLATVSLSERVRGDFLLLQGDQDPINLKNGRERQILPGPYAMVYQGEELGIINIDANETRMIEVSQ
ncbi:vWA domain-containing protein [Pseudaestuariivita rosea]|uniref:vWA domain-containing protein n=1 Tax=Pseudaestuariivita rosea TaxID=2763263 RepID=UPI001ABB2008|nr:VWA domain-containing protein [Pseudaestuariivita rosea]